MQKRAQYRDRKHIAGEAANLTNPPTTSKTLKPSKVIPPSGRYDEVDFCTKVYFAGVDDDFEGKREQDVKDLIDRCKWKFNPRNPEAHGRLRDYFIDKELCVATVNVYYEDEERMLPSELSILKFSIRRGIFAQKNFIIGLTDDSFPNEMCEQDAKEHEMRTGIAADPEKMRGVARLDFENIWGEIKEFTKIAEHDAKLLVLADDWNLVVGSFFTLFTHVNETEFCRVETRFMTIEDYSLAVESLLTDVSPSEEMKSVIGTQFREKWTGAVVYDMVTCELHTPMRYTNECQAKECSLLFAHEAAFNFFTECQERILLDYPFGGSHMPRKSQLPKAECEADCQLLNGSRGRSRSRSRQQKTAASSTSDIPIDINSAPVQPLPKSILRNSMTRSKSTVIDRQLPSEQNFRSTQFYQPQTLSESSDGTRSQPDLMQFLDEDLLMFDEDDCHSVNRIQEVTRHPFIDPRVTTPVFQQPVPSAHHQPFPSRPQQISSPQSVSVAQLKDDGTDHDDDIRRRSANCIAEVTRIPHVVRRASPADLLQFDSPACSSKPEFGPSKQAQIVASRAETSSAALEHDLSGRMRYNREEIQMPSNTEPSLASLPIHKAFSQLTTKSAAVGRNTDVSEKEMKTFASQPTLDSRKSAANHFVPLGLNEFVLNANERVEEDLVHLDTQSSLLDSRRSTVQNPLSQNANEATSASTISDAPSLGGFSPLNILHGKVPWNPGNRRLPRTQSNKTIKREHDFVLESTSGSRNFRGPNTTSMLSAASSSSLCGTRSAGCSARSLADADSATFTPKISGVRRSSVRFELDGSDTEDVSSSTGLNMPSVPPLMNQQLQREMTVGMTASASRSASNGYSVPNGDAGYAFGADTDEGEHRIKFMDPGTQNWRDTQQFDDKEFERCLREWVFGNEVLNENSERLLQ